MSDIKLPELPRPSPTHYRENGWKIERLQMYTADQMREYARSAVLAAATPGQVEAVRLALAALEENHQWHQDYDDYGGYPESKLCEQNEAAIRALKSASVSEQKGERNG